MNKILPIEIKSYKKHSALNNVLSHSGYEIDNSIVFYNGNVDILGKITYLPIYMIMFIEEQNIDFADISLDKFEFYPIYAKEIWH